MFKGLRTKIESEQLDRVARPTISQRDHPKPKDVIPSDQNGSDQKLAGLNDVLDRDTTNDTIDNPSIDLKTTGIVQCNESTLDSALKGQHGMQSSSIIDDFEAHLPVQSNSTDSVIKKEDAVTEVNSKSMSNGVSTKFNDNSPDVIDQTINNRHMTKLDNNNDSDKSIQMHDSAIKTADSVQHVEDKLREEVEALKNKLSQKTRQLKINLQNMSDIKRALQKEIAEHARTQDELTRVQLQFKTSMEKKVQSGQAELDSHHPADSDANAKSFEQGLSDKNMDNKVLPVYHGKFDEANGIDQKLDVISNLSRSSASFDDLDQSESNHNNSTKEVNHEYLRNVLFRYMTSTDTETTQHLVKALSVLMNFTPEQTAAVKTAMYAKSSWLRLKK